MNSSFRNCGETSQYSHDYDLSRNQNAFYDLNGGIERGVDLSGDQAVWTCDGVLDDHAKQRDPKYKENIIPNNLGAGIIFRLSCAALVDMQECGNANNCMVKNCAD